MTDFDYSAFRRAQIQDPKAATDAMLEMSQNVTTPYEIQILEESFVVHAGVFSPQFFSSSIDFARALPDVQGKRVLDVGCGIGMLAVFAAKRGACTVLAVDISEEAIRNAQENILKHGLQEIVTTRVSDVYSALSPDERFDVIMWNAPFGYVEEETSMLSRSVYDPFYTSIAEYMRHGRDHLTPSGKLFLGMSTTLGNSNKIQEIATAAQLSLTVHPVHIPTEENPVALEWIECA